MEGPSYQLSLLVWGRKGHLRVQSKPNSMSSRSPSASRSTSSGSDNASFSLVMFSKELGKKVIVCMGTVGSPSCVPACGPRVSQASYWPASGENRNGLSSAEAQQQLLN